LGNADERDASQRIAIEAALTAVGAARAQQPFALVIPATYEATGASLDSPRRSETPTVAANAISDVISRPIDVGVARHAITRVAAWSMLQESSQHAPYGWTHCLTMAQAAMGLAGDGLDARTAVAVAGTYVAGFRAALGERPLDPGYEPPRPDPTDLGAAIDSGTEAAAAAIWHASDDELDAIVTELATRAALHHDAHLVKYTLACIHAAEDDPQERRLYLAAAASLSAWWSQRPTDGFFA